MLVIPPPPTSILSRATAVDVADAFSTDLWTGNDVARSITNGVDLSGEGGLVWIKGRTAALDHKLTDTERGATKWLKSYDTSAEQTDADGLTAFNSDGFALGATHGGYNSSSYDYVGWTFRKAAGFFDVVEYTGNGATGQTISHDLGITPGMIIVKDIDNAYAWGVWHKDAQQSPMKTGELNSTGAFDVYGDSFTTTPTSSGFEITDGGSGINASSTDYVAYLFGHDTDGIIQCGSYTGTGAANLSVALGWKPQLVMIKRTDSTGSWIVLDNERSGGDAWDDILYPNLSFAEGVNNSSYAVNATSTGLDIDGTSADINASGGTYIYMAIKAED